MRFRARQWIAAYEAAFSWRARFPILPAVNLHVEDAFEAGHGRLTGRLFGWIPLFSQWGLEIDRGEVLRYLAELPWAPPAYLFNQALRWEETASGLLRVSCDTGEGSVSLDYEVDAEGRVTSVRTEARPYEHEGVFVDRPWIGRFEDWRELDGIRVPTRGEVSWDLPEGRYTYWRGQVTSLSLESS